MPRKLEWIDSQNFQGYGRAECNWKFRASGALEGDPLDKMKEYEAQRDKEFAAHVCAKHRRTTRRKT
jgi:hypothetical protein